MLGSCHNPNKKYLNVEIMSLRRDLIIAGFRTGLRVDADINHSANAPAMKRKHLWFDIGFAHMHGSMTLLPYKGFPARVGSFPGSLPDLAEERAKDWD